jgi:hypothetical protein
VFRVGAACHELTDPRTAHAVAVSERAPSGRPARKAARTAVFSLSRSAIELSYDPTG